MTRQVHPGGSVALDLNLTVSQESNLKLNRRARRQGLKEVQAAPLAPELLHKLEVIYRDPRTLQPNARNARTHGERQIAQLIASITEFGFTNPILIDSMLQVIAGHARLDAALQMNMAEVPTILIDGLSGAQVRALMLADNKIALNAGWDLQMLREELLELLDPEIDLAELTGFNTAEIEGLVMLGQDAGGEDEAVADAIDRSVPARTKPGDLWILGEHKLLCGDALKEESYGLLLGDERPQQVLSDPPWNLRADEIGGLGKVKHADFAMAAGEMSDEEFTEFLKVSLANMARHAVDGAILMIFIDWRGVWHLISAARALGLELKNICVWDKGNGGMGTLYRSQHELIGVFKSGTASHVNNIQLGKYGRYRTNVWTAAGANSFRKGREADLATHPTVKPVPLLVDAIRDCSTRGGIILDPFGGSGSTLLAAERAGRKARLIELDPWYVDAAVARWERMTSQTAVLSSNPTSGTADRAA